MWQRFSERARKVVFYSQEEAQKYGEAYVSTEHLLLGLCREEDSLAARILTLMGVSLNRVRAEVEKNLNRDNPRPSQDMTLTPRAKRVIDLAYEEARALSNNYIGTEHLLLGLIREGDGLAGRALKSLNVKLDLARTTAVQVQDGDLHRDPVPTPGFIERIRRRFAYSDPAPTVVEQQSGISLQARFDFQTLHPVDQMLLAVLSDDQSEFAKEIRENHPTLAQWLPAITAHMATSPREFRTSFSEVLQDAHQFALKASRNQVDCEDLFMACVLRTTDEVRQALSAIGLNPFRQDEIPRDSNQTEEKEP